MRFCRISRTESILSKFSKQKQIEAKIVASANVSERKSSQIRSVIYKETNGLLRTLKRVAKHVRKTKQQKC